MVTSKFKPYGIFRIVFACILEIATGFMIFLFCSKAFFSDLSAVKGTLTHNQAIIFGLVFSSIFLLVAVSIHKVAVQIKVDEEHKQITFTGVFTRLSKIYLFSYFDGWIDTWVDSTNLGVEKHSVLYFIKNGKIAHTITGEYFKNMDELRNSLPQEKYLGFEKDFNRLARKAIFGGKVFQ